MRLINGDQILYNEERVRVIGETLDGRILVENIENGTLQRIDKNSNYSIIELNREKFINFIDIEGKRFSYGDLFIDKDSINEVENDRTYDITIFIKGNDIYEDHYYNQREFNRDCLIIKDKNNPEKEWNEFIEREELKDKSRLTSIISDRFNELKNEAIRLGLNIKDIFK